MLPSDWFQNALDTKPYDSSGIRLQNYRAKAVNKRRPESYGVSSQERLRQCNPYEPECGWTAGPDEDLCEVAVSVAPRSL